LLPGGSYRLTPFYDIISAFPVLGGTGLHLRDLKLSMGLNATKGRKTRLTPSIRVIFWRPPKR
jgi:serine/threonine-protein kinase HipA